MSMTIINNRVISYYQKASSATGVKKPDSASAASSAGKTDQITISHEAASHSTAGGLVQSVASEVETSVSSARLQQLSEQIAAGEYRIPTDKLVDSLFGGF